MVNEKKKRTITKQKHGNRNIDERVWTQRRADEGMKHEGMKAL